MGGGGPVAEHLDAEGGGRMATEVLTHLLAASLGSAVGVAALAIVRRGGR